MAAMVDEVRNLSYIYATSHSDSPGSVQKPEFIQRPGSGGKRGKVMSIENARLLDPRLRYLDDDEVRERMAGRLLWQIYL
jgi:hypothetical protein